MVAGTVDTMVMVVSALATMYNLGVKWSSQLLFHWIFL